ncbi:formyltransferase family protein [Peptococcaceae bacterium 1198_IL3148]
MKILLLGPKRKNIINYLSSFGDEIINTEKPLDNESVYLNGVDYIISYGYRFRISREIIEMFPKKAINLHISLLPWNKGADPNLWSFLEDTPKGVTIHYMDYKIDAGDILVQQEVGYLPNDTLRTSYERLSHVIEGLFIKVWPQIRSGKQKSMPQPEGGTFHYLRDRYNYQYLMTQGWDTPVSKLIGKALKK